MRRPAEADAVRVVPNAGRNTRLWVGRVRDRVWHHRLCRWMYYLTVEGRPIAKRYFREDLVRSG